MYICELDLQSVWTGNYREVTPKDGRPVNWVRAEPPAVPDGQYAQWRGGWHIIDEYPPMPDPIIAWRATADCSALQAEIVIHNMGLTAQVEAIKNDPATPIEAKLALEKAYRWSRKSPLWETFVGPALSMTPEQIDDLFVAAQQIEV